MSYKRKQIKKYLDIGDENIMYLTNKTKLLKKG